tara:strand:+ start:19481 stop:20548 length:1068 start_codon:yes stop_codon:yes gene_type:complete
MKKIALITGVTGQDGAYLSEFLLKKGYEVHGLKRRTSLINTSRIDHLYQEEYVKNRNFLLHYSDLTDSANIIRLIKEINPDEIYNLAAMSHVKVSFEMPEYVSNVDGLGTLRILEAIRLLGLESKTKVYQASTSELYGKVQEIPQSETTPFYPRSPYGVAKLYAFWISKNYRESYNLFVSNGILFNHESPLRGETFVTRKITLSISKMAYGKQKKLLIGNLDAKRDWGHARDYVEMMWLILQQDVADDYVIATGKTYSVRYFIKTAFKHIGVTVHFEGKGLDEKGIVKSVNNTNYNFNVGQIVVEVDSRYFRPSEVDLLVGDPTKAKKNLGWKAKISLPELISEMMDNDMRMAGS